MKKSILLTLSMVNLLSLSSHGIDINVQTGKGFENRHLYAQVEINGTFKKPAEIEHIGVVADPVPSEKFGLEKYMFQTPFTMQNIKRGATVKIKTFVPLTYSEMAIPITIPPDAKRNIALKVNYEKGDVTFELKGDGQITIK